MELYSMLRFLKSDKKGRVQMQKSFHDGWSRRKTKRDLMRCRAARSCGAWQLFGRAGSPRIGSKGSQTPTRPCLVTAGGCFSLLPRGDKIAAYRGTSRMNGTMNGLADDAPQGDAPGPGLVGSFHYQSEIIEFFSHFDRHAVIFYVARFSPVKRGTKKSAAGAAFKAGVGFLHRACQSHGVGC